MSEENGKEKPGRNWRDQASYADLQRLDRRGFAWEYLRRNPRFREEAAAAVMPELEVRDGVRVVVSGPDARAVAWGLRFHRASRRSRDLGPPVLA